MVGKERGGCGLQAEATLPTQAPSIVDATPSRLISRSARAQLSVDPRNRMHRERRTFISVRKIARVDTVALRASGRRKSGYAELVGNGPLKILLTINPQSFLESRMSAERLGVMGRSAASLFAAQAAGQLIGFVALAMVSRRIGPTWLGAYGIAAQVAGYGSIFLSTGVWIHAVRDYVNSGAPRRVTGEVLGVQMLLALVFLLILLAASFLGGDSRRVFPLLAIVGLKLATDGLSVEWLLGAMGAFPKIAAARFFGQVVYGVIVVATLADGRDGAIHYAWANVLGFSVVTALMFVTALKHGSVTRPVLGLGTARRRLNSSRHVLAGFACTQIYSNSGALCVGLLCAVKEAGYFAGPMRAAQAIMLVASSWASVLLPHAARRIKSEADEISRDTSSIVAFSAAVAIFISLSSAGICGPLVRVVFGHEFGPAAPSFALQICGASTVLVSASCNNLLLAASSDGAFLRIACWAAIWSVVGSLALVPRYGSLGASIVWFAAELIVLVGSLRAVSGGLLELDLNLRPLWGAAAAGGAVLMTEIVGALVIRDNDQARVIGAAVACLPALLLMRRYWRPPTRKRPT